MFDLVRVEQLGAWVERASGGERGFDYAHGFVTGCACAPEKVPVENLLRCAFEDGDFDEASGIDPQLFLRELFELSADITGSLEAGEFRPHMGRYIRRLKEDSPAFAWCIGFLKGILPFSEKLKADETAKQLLFPAMVLAGIFDAADDGAESIPESDIEEGRLVAREHLVGSVHALYRHFHGG